MTTPTHKSAANIAWDLRALFSGPNDPTLKELLDNIEQQIKVFDKTYRGTIHGNAGLTAQHLLAALQTYENIQSQLWKASNYAYLVYAADTQPTAHRNLLQMIEERMTALGNLLIFFDLEWLAVDDDMANTLIADDTLANYRYYLSSARRFKPHTLSENEERLINDKNLTGINAWQRMFTEYNSATQYKWVEKGETRDLNQSEILALLRSPDRELRMRAFNGFYGVLESQREVRGFIYDTRFQDHLVNNRLRHYHSPIHPRNLANDIDGATVEAMMQVIESNYALAHRYFSLKAKLLGIDKLEIYDQYAPLDEVKKTITYDQAGTKIISAIGKFSAQFANIAQQFFENSWIDAAPRQGKVGGAFCSPINPAIHPYILMSYNDQLYDVMTLAHELGHGMHFYLSGKQTLLNYNCSLPVAETASVFAEMLVFEALLGEMTDPKERHALICHKIEDSFATVFRQAVLTRFEGLVYEARSKGRLSAQEICDYWLKANAPYYGDSLNMTKGYEFGWSYIPHFIGTPFYCYAYSFGLLLTLGLYGMYRREGTSFIPKYTALLESGGSQSVKTQMMGMNIDIADPNFWQVGFDELKRLVDLAEKLAE
jgi:oligoendopeptidase F